MATYAADYFATEEALYYDIPAIKCHEYDIALKVMRHHSHEAVSRTGLGYSVKNVLMLLCGYNVTSGELEKRGRHDRQHSTMVGTLKIRPF